MKRSQFKKLLRESVSKALLENRCWKGYEPVTGKEPYSKGSCRKKQHFDEGANQKSIIVGRGKLIPKHFENGVPTTRVGQKMYNKIQEDLRLIASSKDSNRQRLFEYIKNIREKIGLGEPQDDVFIDIIKNIEKSDMTIHKLFKETFGNMQ